MSEQISVTVHNASELVASVPGLIKRVPLDGEVVIVWIKDRRVESAAVGPAEAITASWVTAHLAATGANQMIGVSFNLTDDQADNLAEEMTPIADRFAEWFAVEGLLVHSLRKGDVSRVPPWQESELAAAMAYEGEVIAPNREAIVAETQPNDLVPDAEQARMSEALEDADVRDRTLYEWTKVSDRDLRPLVEEMAETARRYPTAAVATLTALGYMLTGDMMRSGIWAERALEIDVTYQMALLTLGLLAVHTGPEQARTIFASVYDD